MHSDYIPSPSLSQISTDDSYSSQYQQNWHERSPTSSEASYVRDEAEYYINIIDEEGISWAAFFYGSDPIVEVKYDYAYRRGDTHRLTLDTELFAEGLEYPLDNGTEVAEVFQELGIGPPEILTLTARIISSQGPYEVIVRPFWGWAGVAGLTNRYGPPIVEFWTAELLSVSDIILKTKASSSYPFPEGEPVEMFSSTWQNSRLYLSGPALDVKNTISEMPAHAIEWSEDAETIMFPTGRIDPTVTNNPRAGRIELVISAVEFPEKWCAHRSGHTGYDWEGEMPNLAPAAGGRRNKHSRHSYRRKKINKTRKT